MSQELAQYLQELDIERLAIEQRQGVDPQESLRMYTERLKRRTEFWKSLSNTPTTEAAQARA